MQAATSRSFGVIHDKQKLDSIPAGDQDTFEVVSIAQEHLDPAPESLLSIAASQSPRSEVIALSPQGDLANFVVLHAWFFKFCTQRQRLPKRLQ